MERWGVGEIFLPFDGLLVVAELLAETGDLEKDFGLVAQDHLQLDKLFQAFFELVRRSVRQTCAHVIGMPVLKKSGRNQS